MLFPKGDTAAKIQKHPTLKEFKKHKKARIEFLENALIGGVGKLSLIEAVTFYGSDFSEVLTRAKFEELNADLFKNTMGPVSSALEDSGFKKN